MRQSTVLIVADLIELGEQLNKKRFDYLNFAIAHELNQHRDKEHVDFSLSHYNLDKSLGRKAAFAEEIQSFEKKFAEGIEELRREE